MTSNNEAEIYASITSAISKAACMSIPRGWRLKYKPFWNKDIEIAVQAREKAREKYEKNLTIQNKIAYNRVSAQVKRL